MSRRWSVGACAFLLASSGCELVLTTGEPASGLSAPAAQPAPKAASQPKVAPATSPAAAAAPSAVARPEPEIPDLKGKHIDGAKKTLKELGLTRIEISERESDLRPGTIVHQYPAAGAAAKRYRFRDIRLTVAKKKLDADVPKDTMLPVPKVVGMAMLEASRTLKAAGGWKMKRKAGADFVDVPIVKQSPAPGTMHMSFGDVYVTYPPHPILVVPNVVGMTETKAKAALSKAKFSNKTLKFSQRKVLSQSPAAGTKAKRGTKVTVTLAE